MWDCPKCGCQSILDLPNCPQCGAKRPAGDVTAASVLPAQDVSAAPDAAGDPDSLAGENKDTAAAIDSEPQAPSKKK